MEDTFAKYLRLSGAIILTFLSFIAALVLIMLGLRFFFGMLNSISWFTYFYTVLVIMFPTCLFMSVYIIYFRRTKRHVSKPVRIISYIIFSIALALWLWFFISDLQVFFKYYYNSIGKYNTYNLLFLSCNVGCIFLVGIIQALSTEKEKDWMDRSPRM